MSEVNKTPQPELESLELNKETLQDLTELETDRVKGGAVRDTQVCGADSLPTRGCTSRMG